MVKEKELFRPQRPGHWLGLGLEVVCWASFLAVVFCDRCARQLTGVPAGLVSLILLLQAAGIELFPGTRIGGGDLSGTYYRRPAKEGALVGGLIFLGVAMLQLVIAS